LCYYVSEKNISGGEHWERKAFMVLADYHRHFCVIHSLNIPDFVICVTMPLKKYQWWGLLFKKNSIIDSTTCVAFKDEL